jgi:hypothetical protein
MSPAFAYELQMVDKEFVSLCNIVPRLSFNGGSIMVWDGISAIARTELVLIDMNAHKIH